MNMLKKKKKKNKKKKKENSIICCEECSKIFANHSLLRKHRQKHIKLHRCSFPLICDKSFSNKRDRIIHEKIHSAQKDEICKFCFAKFVHPSTLKKHIKYVHSNGDDPNPFICKKCNKTFSRKESLQRHLHSHLKREKRRLIYCNHCDTSCSKGFVSISNLNRHQRMFH
eukprot:34193_1